MRCCYEKKAGAYVQVSTNRYQALRHEETSVHLLLVETDFTFKAPEKPRIFLQGRSHQWDHLRFEKIHSAKALNSECGMEAHRCRLRDHWNGSSSGYLLAGHISYAEARTYNIPSGFQGTSAYRDKSPRSLFRETSEDMASVQVAIFWPGNKRANRDEPPTILVHNAVYRLFRSVFLR